MKKTTFGDIAIRDWFAIGERIYIKGSSGDDRCFMEGGIGVNVTKNDTILCSNVVEVNPEWWEAIGGDEDAPKWLIIKAYQNGAKIECQLEGESEWNSLAYPSWNWDSFKYRVKPTTHTIKIDGKEIELSEESYNALKKSLAK